MLKFFDRPVTIICLAVTDTTAERDHMPNFHRVLAQLRSERDRAEEEVQRIDDVIRTIQHLNGTGRGGARRAGRQGKRTVSAAARARIAAAQRARRARENAKRSKPRHMSAAARRRIAAAQRARWAKLKGQQGKEKKAA